MWKEAEIMAYDPKDSIAGFLARVMSTEGSAAPKNRVRVSIAGQEFTILASESSDYVNRCASLVDARIKNVMASGRFSLTEAAILAACNIADEQIKATGYELRLSYRSLVTYNGEPAGDDWVQPGPADGPGKYIVTTSCEPIVSFDLQLP